jgi:hypothetical protein
MPVIFTASDRKKQINRIGVHIEKTSNILHGDRRVRDAEVCSAANRISVLPVCNRREP